MQPDTPCPPAPGPASQIAVHLLIPFLVLSLEKHYVYSGDVQKQSRRLCSFFYFVAGHVSQFGHVRRVGDSQPARFQGGIRGFHADRSPRLVTLPLPPSPVCLCVWFGVWLCLVCLSRPLFPSFPPLIVAAPEARNSQPSLLFGLPCALCAALRSSAPRRVFISKHDCSSCFQLSDAVNQPCERVCVCVFAAR